MSPSSGKRRRSPSPNSLLRRVKPRSLKEVVSEPEEGEVEDTSAASEHSRHQDAKSPATNGVSASPRKDDKLDLPSANGLGGGDSKVPFPFKNKRNIVKSFPRVDLENGPPASLPPKPLQRPLSPRGGARNGDSYRPDYDERDGVRRQRHRSPMRRGYDDHRRLYSPRRDDGGRDRDVHRDRDRERGRGMDSYVPSHMRSSPRRRPSRSPPRRRLSPSPGRGDFYRPVSPHRRHDGGRSRSPSGDYCPHPRLRSRSRTPSRGKGGMVHRLPERGRYSPPLLQPRSLMDRLGPSEQYDRVRDRPRYGSRELEDKVRYDERVPSPSRSYLSRSPPLRSPPSAKTTSPVRGAPNNDEPGRAPSSRMRSPAPKPSVVVPDTPHPPENVPPPLPPQPVQLRPFHPLPSRPAVPEAFLSGAPPPPPPSYTSYPHTPSGGPTLSMAPPPSQPPYGPPPPHVQQHRPPYGAHMHPPHHPGYPQGPPPGPYHQYPPHTSHAPLPPPPHQQSYPPPQLHPPQPSYPLPQTHQHQQPHQQPHQLRPPPPPLPPQQKQQQPPRTYSPMMPPPPKPKKEAKLATVRTKEQEKAVYGWIFVGSGRLSEYDVKNKLGEGTFGEVHRATHRITGRDVALKRILMHNEKDGMPITALREIKILKALSHKNIVKVLDIVVTPRKPDMAGSIQMVFPYMDHDLAGLLENPTVKLQPSHIKLYMKQLLEGLEYMHDNNIVHRDIKAANLLISHDGTLQIADFGLARAYAKGTKMEKTERNEKYTNCVVTRWYRPPELLMGERYYGGEIDIWGVGCILAEMFTRKPILPGSTDLDQLEKIWSLCGTPTADTWPDFENLPGLEGVKTFKSRPKTLQSVLGRMEALTHDCMMIIDQLLTLDPAKRPTAPNALLHEYFWCDPLPADPEKLPKFESSHELDRRRKAPPPPQQQGGPQLPVHQQHQRGPARYPPGPGGPPGPHTQSMLPPRPHGAPSQGGGHPNWRNNGPGHGPAHNNMPPQRNHGDRRQQGRPPFKGPGNTQPAHLPAGLPQRPDFVGHTNGRGPGPYGPPLTVHSQPAHNGPPPTWPATNEPPPTASGGLNYG